MDVERLKADFLYDPDTGSLARRRSGKLIGCVNSRGYLICSVLGKVVGAHRVAFALANGRWPSELIDHINGDKLDNRAANLREASRALNSLNRKQKSGLGVRVERNGRFSARLRGRHLGTFDTKDEAESVYRTQKEVEMNEACR